MDVHYMIYIYYGWSIVNLPQNLWRDYVIFVHAECFVFCQGFEQTLLDRKLRTVPLGSQVQNGQKMYIQVKTRRSCSTEPWENKNNHEPLPLVKVADLSPKKHFRKQSQKQMDGTIQKNRWYQFQI